MADGKTAAILTALSMERVIWKVSISDSMPLTLQFNGTVDGDEVTVSVMLETSVVFPSLGLAVKCASPASGAPGQGPASARTFGSGYGRFTEGFDTRDLKEAKTLLEALVA